MMKKQITDIVISPEMSQQLKEAGVRSFSLYGYFKTTTEITTPFSRTKHNQACQLIPPVS
jgi:hypothetical protein